MMIRVHYPAPESEFQMLVSRLEHVRVEMVADPQAVLAIRQQVGYVHVDDKIRRYIVALGRATRNNGPSSLPIVREMVQHGASPRSYQHLLAMSRAAAFFRGRDYVTPSDIKFIATRRPASHRPESADDSGPRWRTSGRTKWWPRCFGARPSLRELPKEL